MRPPNALRAAHRSDGGDPQTFVGCGRLTRRNNNSRPAPQASRDAVITAIATSRADTAIASAIRVALKKGAAS